LILFFDIILYYLVEYIYLFFILLDNSFVKIVNASISKNENRISANGTCEIYMIDIIEKKFKENPNVQAKYTKIQKVKMNKI
jgi:hypothetical protein